MTKSIAIVKNVMWIWS